MSNKILNYDLKPGEVYGKWTMLHSSGTNKWGRPIFYCRCACGKEKDLEAYALLTGKTKSCNSCANRKERPFSYQKLYGVWNSMRSRCQRPNDRNYQYYGGRGIKVCKEWNTFPPFEAWAKSRGYREGLTIDRINNDGDYCPENCRWVTQKVQTNNSRNVHWITYKGQTKNLSEWAAEIGLTPHGLFNRLNHYPPEIALEFPKMKEGQKDLAKSRNTSPSTGN